MSSALPTASVTPNPAHTAPTIPIARATPLPFKDVTSRLSCSPITGICATVESSTSFWKSGLPSSRNPRIDANASSSGKIEKKAQYAMSAARRDAPSSVNFFATAHGTAVSDLDCCQRSIASRTGCALIARRLMRRAAGIARVYVRRPARRSSGWGEVSR